MTTWRLLDTPPLSAADNMALDETLVELKGQGQTPNTLRFLQFATPCVLVGYHQSLQEELRLDFCRANGIDINRRITGGGAIFFDTTQLGWEIICDKRFFDVRVPNQKLFRTLCEPVVTALAHLGLTATFRPRNDIEIQGRKISGTGGTESGEAFLFQGTLLVDFDIDTMLKCLKIPVEKLKAKEIDSVRQRVTCLKWELEQVPSLKTIKWAIQAGFEQHLQIQLQAGELTPQEIDLLNHKRPRFHDQAWINAVVPRANRREVLQAAYKSEAGLVRYTVVVNPVSKRLQDIFITGDFLSFPARALYDLEAGLRQQPLHREHLAGYIQDFFDQGRMDVPGMTAADFIKPLFQILNKFDIARTTGLSLAHCNQISVTGGTFADILARRPQALLLPYCAKLVDCDLRYAKDCRICGECTIGEAWQLGGRHHLQIISITSFEDLMQELQHLADRGASAWIGCCCQPFFTKHLDDFNRIGLPGILLDIDCTTCYEMDLAPEAYQGRFDRQTEINLNLLEEVLQRLPV